MRKEVIFRHLTIKMKVRPKKKILPLSGTQKSVFTIPKPTYLHIGSASNLLEVGSMMLSSVFAPNTRVLV